VDAQRPRNGRNVLRPNLDRSGESGSGDRKTAGEPGQPNETSDFVFHLYRSILGVDAGFRTAVAQLRTIPYAAKRVPQLEMMYLPF
jgi:hypothetical protein